MARGAAGNSIIWIVVAILIGAYAFWLSGQVDAANERAAQAREREQALITQLQQVAAQSASRSTRSADATTEAIATALLRRPDLIGFEGEVGGTFFFLEDSVVVLSDRYAYAACEDGHVMCHVLLAYERSDDGFDFKVIDAYRD